MRASARPSCPVGHRNGQPVRSAQAGVVGQLGAGAGGQQIFATGRIGAIAPPSQALREGEPDHDAGGEIVAQAGVVAQAGSSFERGDPTAPESRLDFVAPRRRCSGRMTASQLAPSANQVVAPAESDIGRDQRDDFRGASAADQIGAVEEGPGQPGRRSDLGEPPPARRDSAGVVEGIERT